MIVNVILEKIDGDEAMLNDNKAVAEVISWPVEEVAENTGNEGRGENG